MNTLTDEKKQALKAALFERGATKKFLADISDTQELIFMIALLEDCSDKNVGFNINDSRELIYKHLCTKISELKKCFLITDKSTGGLLIKQGCADLYSCREFADAAVKYYNNLGVECSVFESEELSMNVFEFMYYLGIKNILIDCTPETYNIKVKRNEILSKAKIKKEENSDCKIDNPSLRFAISNFYCSLHHKEAFNVSDKRLTNLQNIMIYETAHAKYIVPTMNNNSENITLAKISIENQGEMFPVFTDKTEFEKWNKSKEWGYIILDFNNTLASVVSGNCNGIVINPFGERLSIDRKTLANIRKTAEHMVVK